MLATIDRNIGRDADDGAGPEHTAATPIAVDPDDAYEAVMLGDKAWLFGCLERMCAHYRKGETGKVFDVIEAIGQVEAEARNDRDNAKANNAAMGVDRG